MLSDVLLVPFQPRSYDVWALNDIAALVDEARSVRDGLRVYAVLNCAAPARLPPTTAKPPQRWQMSRSLNTSLPRSAGRKAFANAAGQGLAVLELSPKDAKAIEELNHIVSALF